MGWNKMNYLFESNYRYKDIINLIDLYNHMLAIEKLEKYINLIKDYD